MTGRRGRATRGGLAALAAGMLLLVPVTGQGAVPDARLEVFKQACLPQHRQPEARPEVVRAAGFVAAPDKDHPMLAEVMAISRQKEGELRADGVRTETSVWRRDGGDHPLYLVLTTAWAEPIALSGCYLFDFGAEAGIAPEAVSAWLAERPAQTIDQSGMTAQIWNVETIDGVWDLQNSQVSAGSRAAMIVGYDGASIKLTSTVAAVPSGEGDANRTNPGN